MSEFKKNLKSDRVNGDRFGKQSEKGAALVIALLIMLLLMGFVAVVISRSNFETVITANDSAENLSLNAAQAQVEWNSRDFRTLFSRKLSPTTTDIDTIRNSTVTGFTNYDFTRKFIRQKKSSVSTLISEGDYKGLYSLRDEWEIDATAKDTISGVESRVIRSFNNDRIPLFQFGMFYEDDLELNRPPLFTFGGRVHTNSNLFISASPVSTGGGIYFNSKTTVVREIINDIWKTGTTHISGYDDQNGVFFADAGGTNRELLTNYASVNCANPSGANVFAADPKFPNNVNLPNCSARAAWESTDKLPFQGNLDNHKPRLDLPLYRLNVNLTELIKRGKNVGDMVKSGTNSITAVTTATDDEPTLAFERFANKPGIRISLADAQNKLPGCAAATGPGANNNACGVRLDLNASYQPKNMQDSATYKTTPLNATRFAQTGKEMWIKVEIVDFDYDNNVPTTKDITEDILSLGVTEPAPFHNDFQIQGHTEDPSNPGKSYNDSRSIIKLQRFTIRGTEITSGTNYISKKTIGGEDHNLVVRKSGVGVTVAGVSTGCNLSVGLSVDEFSAPQPKPQYTSGSDEDSQRQCLGAMLLGKLVWDQAIVPFPIQMFDTREGIANDRNDAQESVPGISSFGTDNVTRAGKMSMIDIDVENLRKFLNGGAGSFNNLFPTTTPFAVLKGAGQSLNAGDVAANTNGDLPHNKGWVVYVSDRRGDADFDGEYDMEDVIPDGVQQFNEDVNGTGVFNPGNGVFERLFYDLDNNFFEAPRYSETLLKGQAATADHGYYRRGVRLINAKKLPGRYDRLNPTLTRGFTLASENGVYVQGNYNAEDATLTGTTAPAPAENYLPQGGTLTQAGSATNAMNHVPAAIVSDATTILSNNWNDARSFQSPFNEADRPATNTQIRFALLTGDVITGKNATGVPRPSETGGLGNGGVHNFKRFLEQWTGDRLNYVGSLVNLFNSRNNNAFFKCCDAVYDPPTRDWTFDTTFVDPNRLPPGTPYIYSMNFTGFQRVND